MKLKRLLFIIIYLGLLFCTEAQNCSFLLTSNSASLCHCTYPCTIQTSLEITVVNYVYDPAYNFLLYDQNGLLEKTVCLTSNSVSV
jgi:hypothetical protein